MRYRRRYVDGEYMPCMEVVVGRGGDECIRSLIRSIKIKISTYDST